MLMLFFKPMRSMFPVLHRMAVRAKYFEIIKSVIVPVAVYVVHAKYARFFRVTASRTAGEKTSREQCFTNRCKSGFPNGFFSFVDTFLTAVNSFFGGTSLENRVAVPARDVYRSFCMHRLVIAHFGTVFRFIGARGYMLELRSALFAGRTYVLPLGESSATSGAVLERFQTVRRDRYLFGTMFAVQEMSHAA